MLNAFEAEYEKVFPIQPLKRSKYDSSIGIEDDDSLDHENVPPIKFSVPSGGWKVVKESVFQMIDKIRAEERRSVVEISSPAEFIDKIRNLLEHHLQFLSIAMGN